jgi:hypothetical protein
LNTMNHSPQPRHIAADVSFKYLEAYAIAAAAYCSRGILQPRRIAADKN